MTLYEKVTTGQVVQVFNDAGECIYQKFIAGDEVEYRDGESGFEINPMDTPGNRPLYHHFDMVQPS
jgi:hypothetical protein